MALYRVRQGYRHGIGKKYGPGDLVELTEAEAQGFLDKLERVQDAPQPTTGAFVTNPAPSNPDKPDDEDDNPAVDQGGEPDTGDADGVDDEGEPEPIGADFPGAIALARAGITHLDQVPRDEAALIAISGIGKATAEDILAALGA